MSDELVIRQVWPAPHGHSVISPFEGIGGLHAGLLAGQRSHRCLPIGLLRQQHPGRTVFARPPESEDDFWQSMGREHVRHTQNGDYPPLFLQR